MRTSFLLNLQIDFLYTLGYSVSRCKRKKRFGVYHKVKTYMEKYQMVGGNDTVVVGVSGGADSVCLFLLLNEYCKQKNARLVAVHLNHKIRTDACEDAQFVKALCEEYGVTLHIFEEDVEAYAKQNGIGTEEAGRIARYRAFEQVLTEYGSQGKIAVAHHKGDLAETVLFHLFRGSGIAGLTGIAPVRGNIIRPLLDVTREEIEQFLLEKGRTWCIDSTNQENTYTRNKLRNVLLPYAEKEICPQATAHVANAANELTQIKGLLDEMTEEALEAVVVFESDDEAAVLIKPFLQKHEVIRKQVLLRVLENLTPARRDIGSVHVNDVLSLFEKENGKQIHLPYRLVATKVYDRVVIRRQQEETGEWSLSVTIPGEIGCESGEVLEFSVFEYDKSVEIPRKRYTKWFDYDKIINCLELRNRRTGDYLTIYADSKRKSVKEYFIEEKIPREERDGKILLADGNHILWVVGMRISEQYKVTEQTKNILQVTVSDKDE